MANSNEESKNLHEKQMLVYTVYTSTFWGFSCELSCSTAHFADKCF